MEIERSDYQLRATAPLGFSETERGLHPEVPGVVDNFLCSARERAIGYGFPKFIDRHLEAAIEISVDDILIEALIGCTAMHRDFPAVVIRGPTSRRPVVGDGQLLRPVIGFASHHEDRTM